MPRRAPRKAYVAILSGALLTALGLLWSSSAAAAELPSSRGESTASLQKMATAKARQISALQRRAELHGTTARLRHDMRVANTAVVALNRSTVALNHVVLSRETAGDVASDGDVESLISLDREIVLLDTKAAKLTLRLGVPHKRLVVSRILSFREKVSRYAAALESLRNPTSRPAPSPLPTPPPTPPTTPAPTPAPAPTSTPQSVTPFPATALPGVSIGALPALYETSGLAWHGRLGKLLAVSDGGTLSSMSIDGSEIVNWSVPGDLEGICVADPQSDFVYVGVEHPDSILEVDVRTGVVTRAFDLTKWLTSADNQGLEALAFVPTAGSPEGGVFYAGLQADGRIYAFALPIVSSATATSVSYQGTITLEAGLADIADLSYDRDSGVLLSVFDGPNRLKATTHTGQVLQEWDLPGTEQEGVTLVDGALYVGEDHGGASTGRIIRYAPFQLEP